jgi:hypothetical protein
MPKKINSIFFPKLFLKEVWAPHFSAHKKVSMQTIPIYFKWSFEIDILTGEN